MKKTILIVFFLSFFLSACLLETKTENVSISNEKKLTLMIYMAADNDLEKYALANLRAMEQTFHEGLNVIALIDRAEGYDETDGNWTDTRLFEVSYDAGNDKAIKSKQLNCPQLGLSVSESTELDMADSSVLKAFVNYAMTEYKAENYALIVWGHGAGWRGATIDDRSDTYMSLNQLGKALGVGVQKLSVIGFDTCFGGVMENLYELKDCSDYIVACPGVTPGSGWDYSKLLKMLTSEDITPQRIALCMTECSAVSTSLFENKEIADFYIAFENFSHQLADKIIDSQSQRRMFDFLNNCKSYYYSQNPCDIYIDINSLANLFITDSDYDVRNTAQNLISQIKKICPSNQIETGNIGIHYIPKNASGALASVHAFDYVKTSNNTSQCKFVKESQWWVPTEDGNSGSLLDKLFYTSF